MEKSNRTTLDYIIQMMVHVILGAAVLFNP